PSRDIGDLLRAGVVFSSDAYNAGPSYVFTALTDLKTDMLAEATQRAREAAQQFADDAGAQVGTIQTANQGVFEILAAVEIPDQRSEKQMDKKVRVVTTITYFLE
ncbi:MAG TPA: SIMPL domain-containing protein, partial [Pelagibacterium sp.]|nr:SIMPL domain-containing protein [Pelagibacterium sp.]